MSFRDAAQPITVPATGSQRVLGGPSLLMGWSFLETSGVATATLEVWDGADTTAQLVVVISLVGGESTRDWLGPNGVYCGEGLFCNIVSGTVRGTLWARMRHPGTG